MITTNNRIAVSIPGRRDVSVKFNKGGVPELSTVNEFCVLDVVFPSDSGYRPGQKVCLDGDFVKQKFKTYKYEGKEFTLISKEMVLGVVNPPAPKLSQEEIDDIMYQYNLSNYPTRTGMSMLEQVFGLDGLPVKQETDSTVPTKGYRAPTALPASLVPGTGVPVEE